MVFDEGVEIDVVRDQQIAGFQICQLLPLFFCRPLGVQPCHALLYLRIVPVPMRAVLALQTSIIPHPRQLASPALLAVRERFLHWAHGDDRVDIGGFPNVVLAGRIGVHADDSKSSGCGGSDVLGSAVVPVGVVLLGWVAGGAAESAEIEDGVFVRAGDALFCGDSERFVGWALGQVVLGAQREDLVLVLVLGQPSVDVLGGVEV